MENTNKEKVREIVKLTQDGCLRREISDIVEVSPKTVYKYQKLYNLI